MPACRWDRLEGDPFTCDQIGLHAAYTANPQRFNGAQRRLNVVKDGEGGVHAAAGSASADQQLHRNSFLLAQPSFQTDVKYSIMYRSPPSIPASSNRRH